MIRQEIPDEAWAWLEPLLPDRTPKRGGRWRDHRTIFEAIVWRFRTGAPWRDLPDHYGPWQTVYHRFSTWSADGTWDRLLARRGTRGGRPPKFDQALYQRRNVVERSFSDAKQWRGLASRTDKLAINYLGAVVLRATLAWLS